MESILPFGNSETRPLVLIVDDDPAARESLAAVMEGFGFRTSTAGDGFEGLEAMQRETPSAIITDLQMPGMDGFELLTALRHSRSTVPVIAMSGGISAGFDLLGAAQRMGAVAAFPKPLPVLEVIDAISGLTTRRAA